MSLIEIALIAVISLAVFFALRNILIKRKGGCSCGCAECGSVCGKSCRNENPRKTGEQS